ncbi:hypothetical protein SLEP1_g41444 [Rubroshorea leprosula]|uniref:Uncharacterized protein n=1 Tax=Rubroshorea leprosula TaxID=152421 RepID=A0AAV5L723_9ROSI|nr:hypothetical protein SLEP1_g41444 [Rubroshorea leprosula]
MLYFCSVKRKKRICAATATQLGEGEAAAQFAEGLEGATGSGGAEQMQICSAVAAAQFGEGLEGATGSGGAEQMQICSAATASVQCCCSVQ